MFTQNEEQTFASSVAAKRLPLNGKNMKKEISKQPDVENDDLRPEYDFRNMAGGVRGKYYKAYRAGHTVKIHKADGTTVVHHFRLVDGAVFLEPEVRKHFPNSKSVNKALRRLIPPSPRKPRTKKKV